MKKYCKNIDITDIDFIKQAICDWRASRKEKELRTRPDIVRLFKQYKSDEELAEQISKEIKTRTISFRKPMMTQRVDGSNGKVRDICIKDCKMQIYDYIVKNGLKPLTKRIGEYQLTCIKGRGTIWGLHWIQTWMNDKDIRFVKQFDIIKNYRSTKTENVMLFLEYHVKNDDLIYTTGVLLSYSFDGGLMIGSVLSVTLDALYLSQLYHYLMEDCVKIRHHKDGTESRIRLVKHTMFNVDDIAIYCSSQRDANLAEKYLRIKAREIGYELHDEVQNVSLKNNKEFQDMLGFRIYKDHATIRRRDYYKCKTALQNFKNNPSAKNGRTLVSLNTFVKYSDSKTFKRKYRYDEAFNRARKVVGNEDRNIRRKANERKNLQRGQPDESNGMPA